MDRLFQERKKKVWDWQCLSFRPSNRKNFATTNWKQEGTEKKNILKIQSGIIQAGSQHTKRLWSKQNKYQNPTLAFWVTAASSVSFLSINKALLKYNLTVYHWCKAAGVISNRDMEN